MIEGDKALPPALREALPLLRVRPDRLDFAAGYLDLFDGDPVAPGNVAQRWNGWPGCSGGRVVFGCSGRTRSRSRCSTGAFSMSR